MKSCHLFLSMGYTNNALFWEDPLQKDRLPIPVFLGFPCGSVGKATACNVGYLGSVSWLGRSPGEGKGYPLLYSGLENSMDCYSSWVAKSRTRLKRLSSNSSSSTFKVNKNKYFTFWHSSFYKRFLFVRVCLCDDNTTFLTGLL